MGSLVAPVGEDGKLQTHTASADSLTKKSKSKNSTIDSDMFLTLLVAEMQNQDPLEPTSNTEWVSQYATFTQVEKMSEMAESVDLLRANELIGKEVIVKTTNDKTGDVNYKQGTVDYVLVENGKPILVIDDEKYSISDLDSVISSQYSAAYDKYSTLKAMIDGLPDIKYADRSYENVIRGAYEFYNTMDDYEKNFMSTYGSEQMDKFTKWKLRLEELGIRFEEEPEEPEEPKASLDDILDSFNTKMDEILEKLNLLSEIGQTQTQIAAGAAAKEPVQIIDKTPDVGSDEAKEPEKPGGEVNGDEGDEPSGNEVTGNGETGSTGTEPSGNGSTGETGETGTEPSGNGETGDVTGSSETGDESSGSGETGAESSGGDDESAAE